MAYVGLTQTDPLSLLMRMNPGLNSQYQQLQTKVFGPAVKSTPAPGTPPPTMIGAGAPDSLEVQAQKKKKADEQALARAAAQADMAARSRAAALRGPAVPAPAAGVSTTAPAPIGFAPKMLLGL